MLLIENPSSVCREENGEWSMQEMKTMQVCDNGEQHRPHYQKCLLQQWNIRKSFWLFVVLRLWVNFSSSQDLISCNVLSELLLGLSPTGRLTSGWNCDAEPEPELAGKRQRWQRIYYDEKCISTPMTSTIFLHESIQILPSASEIEELVISWNASKNAQTEEMFINTGNHSVFGSDL